MSYKIIGDSCCDYTKFDNGMKWLNRVPLTITLDGIEYVDDASLDCLGLIKKMEKSKEAPKSACPSPGQFMEAYQGDEKDIYVVTLSERLSGTYGSASMAQDMLADSGVTKNVHVFNSKSAAAAEIAICLKIKELADRGLAFDDVVSQVENFIEDMTTIFTLETLEVLRKNGRLTKLQSVITEALQVKMVMGATKEGEVEAIAKALTINAALKKLVEQVKDKCKDQDLSTRMLYITQCNCPERAEMVKNKILETCAFKDVVICEARGISTVYANSGGIILAF